MAGIRTEDMVEACERPIGGKRNHPFLCKLWLIKKEMVVGHRGLGGDKRDPHSENGLGGVWGETLDQKEIEQKMGPSA